MLPSPILWVREGYTLKYPTQVNIAFEISAYIASISLSDNILSARAFNNDLNLSICGRFRVGPMRKICRGNVR